MMPLLDSFDVVKYDEIGSTQDQAKELVARKLIVRPTVILASRQTAGKGQYQRRWVSELGNIYATFCIPINNLFNLEDVPFVASIAIGLTIKEFYTNLNVQYKWVNDVLIDGKKVAGTLSEAIGPWLFLGIGLNVYSNPSLDKPTCCLQDYEDFLEHRHKSYATKEEYLIAIFEVLSLNLRKSFNSWQENGPGSIRDIWSISTIPD